MRSRDVLALCLVTMTACGPTVIWTAPVPETDAMADAAAGDATVADVAEDIGAAEGGRTLDGVVEDVPPMSDGAPESPDAGCPAHSASEGGVCPSGCVEVPAGRFDRARRCFETVILCRGPGPGPGIVTCRAEVSTGELYLFADAAPMTPGYPVWRGCTPEEYALMKESTGTCPADAGADGG